VGRHAGGQFSAQPRGDRQVTGKTTLDEVIQAIVA
jgi:hypothetical protein